MISSSMMAVLTSLTNRGQGTNTQRPQNSRVIYCDLRNVSGGKRHDKEIEFSVKLNMSAARTQSQHNDLLREDKEPLGGKEGVGGVKQMDQVTPKLCSWTQSDDGGNVNEWVLRPCRKVTSCLRVTGSWILNEAPAVTGSQRHLRRTGQWTAACARVVHSSSGPCLWTLLIFQTRVDELSCQSAEKKDKTWNKFWFLYY